MIHYCLTRGLSKCAAVARSLERELLGWELPPIDIALREEPIVPDPPGTWCLRCGESIGRGESTRRGCATCRGKATPLRAVVRLGVYAAPISRHVLRVKRARWFSMGESLGQALAEQVKVSLPPALWPEAVASIPMPVLRRWWRGIDHAEVIATALARRLGVPFLQPLTQRLGPTQVSQSRTDRARNVGRFTSSPAVCASLSRTRPLLLVDDVRTTGATLRQAANEIRRETGLSVVAAVVAVVPSPRRRVHEFGIGPRSSGGDPAS